MSLLVPLTWLQDYIEIDNDIQTLSDALTFSGLEVEGIQQAGSTYDDIVVAEITAVNPHPDADKLTLCTIEFGDDEPMTVVCGAPNVRVGMKTLYAKLGCTLPNGMKLKKAKIRGVVSLGMLCAEDELGLSDAHDGIMDLDASFLPGTPAVDVLGGPETVFELEVTPNRPDCLSIIGVAREIAALTGKELKLPPVGFECVDTPTSDRINVRIEDAEGCPRYTARVLDNVQLGPSPEWMQKRLRLCDVRPINNAVDITNYVMLETGHPLHAFDYKLVAGQEIVVRRARAGEKMNTLDGQERDLLQSDLVIADAKRTVALAGVMGGQDSEIQEFTDSVLLEVAAFDSPSIRATSKRLNLHTESSYRFARGCDETRTDWVSRRAAHLFARLSGAVVCAGSVDPYPGERPLRELRFRWQKAIDLIGVPISTEVMVGFFKNLELEVVEADAEGCIVRIPGFRNDLEREVDLIEEVARLHGLDNIPSPAPRARVVSDASDGWYPNVEGIWGQLQGMGLHQAMHYSLTSPELLDIYDDQKKDRRIVLPNPISQDQAVLRTSLIPQMVETLGRNRSYQNNAIGLYETGKIFWQVDGEYQEYQGLCIGLLGPVGRDVLDSRRPVSPVEAFGSIKGIIEQILHLRNVSNIRFERKDDSAFNAGQSVRIFIGDHAIGRMGLIKDEHKHAWRVTEPMAVAELDITPLVERHFDLPTMSPIPNFPANDRDLTLVVSKGASHAEVMDIIEKKRPKELESVQLFDVFEGKQLGEDKKSVSYTFRYRSPKKTLNDKSVEKIHQQIVQRLCSELGATVPGA